jgi:hypothetical protein
MLIPQSTGHLYYTVLVGCCRCYELACVVALILGTRAWMCCPDPFRSTNLMDDWNLIEIQISNSSPITFNGKEGKGHE